MSTTTITFKGKINELVTIKANNIKGTIKQFWSDENGNIKLFIKYSDKNGLIAENWFTEDELKFINSK